MFTLQMYPWATFTRQWTSPVISNDMKLQIPASGVTHVCSVDLIDRLTAATAFRDSLQGQFPHLATKPQIKSLKVQTVNIYGCQPVIAWGCSHLHTPVIPETGIWHDSCVHKQLQLLSPMQQPQIWTVCTVSDYLWYCGCNHWLYKHLRIDVAAVRLSLHGLRSCSISHTPVIPDTGNCRFLLEKVGCECKPTSLLQAPSNIGCSKLQLHSPPVQCRTKPCSVHKGLPHN